MSSLTSRGHCCLLGPPGCVGSEGGSSAPSTSGQSRHEVVVSHRGTRYEKEYGWQWRAEAESEADKMISQSVTQSESHPQDKLFKVSLAGRSKRNTLPRHSRAHIKTEQFSDDRGGIRSGRTRTRYLLSPPVREDRQLLAKTEQGGSGSVMMTAPGSEHRDFLSTGYGSSGGYLPSEHDAQPVWTAGGKVGKYVFVPKSLHCWSAFATCRRRSIAHTHAQ